MLQDQTRPDRKEIAATPTAVVITSDQNRHKYFAHQIHADLRVVGLISESKGTYYASPEERSTFMNRHFETLTASEAQTFPTTSFPDVPQCFAKRGDVNTPEMVAWVQALNPDIILLFGTGILNAQWIEAFPDKIINLHLGYSPHFRGSATLFWPFYTGDLAHLGTTVHLAAASVDAGKVLSTIPAETIRGDYYTITNQLIKASIDAVPQIARQYIAGEITPAPQDLSIGRVFKKKDFTEDCLRAVLEKYGRAEP